MDWVITWDDACNVTALTNHSSYACLSNNSHCVGSTNGRGSRCKCADGYEGNPYVKGGCIDINECNNRTDPCAAIGGVCQNTQGKFTCLCPPGKHETNGVCVAIPPPLPPSTTTSVPWVMPVVGSTFFYLQEYESG